MSIENNMKRIADALEALVSSQGIVPGSETAEKDTKPATKKKADKQTTVGKPTPDKKKDDAPALTIKHDVRPVLKRLRDEVSQAAVKSLLKKYNASTIQQLDEKDFARVIADAEEDLE